MPGVSRRANLCGHVRAKLLHFGSSLQQTPKEIFRHRGVNECSHPSKALLVMSKIANKARAGIVLTDLHLITDQLMFIVIIRSSIWTHQ
jgi:uncharacterized Zn finger protein